MKLGNPIARGPDLFSVECAEVITEFTVTIFRRIDQ